MARKCENCAGYDPNAKPGLRCTKLSGWVSASFEDVKGDCNCVYFKTADIPPGKGETE